MCRVGSAWGSEDREELRPGELGYEGLDAVVSGENRSWLPVRKGDRVGTNRKQPSTSDSDIKQTKDKKPTKEIKGGFKLIIALVEGGYSPERRHISYIITSGMFGHAVEVMQTMLKTNLTQTQMRADKHNNQC